MTLSHGSVLVTRDPCLHPGDFRRLKDVDIPESHHHLDDCIVISVSSDLKRSHAREMAGELYGDEFMVIFDKDFVESSDKEHSDLNMHNGGNNPYL